MPELLFLGSSGAIQVPSFHCSCRTCQEARDNPKLRRTRASVALIGEEVVLVDAGPDLETQLERESIRRIDRVFITHWHFDHVWGLAALGEPASLSKWPLVDVYLPKQVMHHFDQELSHIQNKVNVHGTRVGDKFELPDAAWTIVKTTHTTDSVGFIIESSKRLAYLVDGVVPPPETVDLLKDLDYLILEATVDELAPQKDEQWVNFSLSQATEFWRQVEARECILTHLSCHSWRNRKLVAGLSHEERLEYENNNPRLSFAYDGMCIKL